MLILTKQVNKLTLNSVLPLRVLPVFDVDVMRAVMCHVFECTLKISMTFKQTEEQAMSKENMSLLYFVSQNTII